MRPRPWWLPTVADVAAVSLGIAVIVLWLFTAWVLFLALERPT